MTLEQAVAQLRRTTGKANLYQASEGDKVAAVYRCYIVDILEDVAALEKHRANFKDKEQEYTNLIGEARDIKRDFEKEAYILEAAAKKKETTPSIASTASSSGSSSALKLPRIKLPIFDGTRVEDFRGFLEAFDDAISHEPSLTPINKWLLLKAQLTGAALLLVNRQPTTPEAYDSARRILVDAYGGKRKAVLQLYRRIQDLPAAQMETESLRTTYAQLEGMLLSLEQLDAVPENDDFLRAIVMGKYPSELMYFLRVTDDMLLTQFRTEVSDYIKLRDCTLQMVGPTPAPVPAASKPPTSTPSQAVSRGGAMGGPSKKPRHVGSGITSSGGDGTPCPPSQVTDKTTLSRKKPRERTKACIFCSGEHWNDECPTYKMVAARSARVEDRCSKCLQPKHAPEDACKSTNVCFYCKQTSHHSSLCPKQFTNVLLTDEATSARFVTAVIPVGNAARTQSANARTVFDTAGGRSLITVDLVEKLQLSAASGRRARLLGVNNVPLNEQPAASRKLLLFPPNEAPIEVEVFVVPEIVENVESTDVAQLKEQFPRYSKLQMPPDGNGEKIQLLLGYRSLTNVLTLHKSILLTPQLQLMSTRFGWVPLGILPTETPERMDSSAIGLVREEDPLKLMCDLELVGLADLLKDSNEEEAKVLEKFYSSIKRKQKRYEIEWPYKEENPELEDNFGLAFGRLASLHKQLSKTPAILEAYDRLISEQLENGIVETVNLLDTPRANLVHYLPHRAIIRLGKSTPIRMVFDAAARCRKLAKCLNDIIMKGGNWVTEIPSILLRFRKYAVGITSDIAKAFHQISIAAKDRDVVRFLWLRDIRKPPSRDNLCIYRFKRMAFGIVASPFLLTSTIRHHLREFPNEFSAIIERDLYADNLITSLPKTIDSEQFYQTSKNCFAEMSMDLVQWTTDDDELRKKFSEADAAEGLDQNVLGLDWNVQTKNMKIRSPNLPTTTDYTTKRIALKEMATVFDPLGWMAPIVLIARIFLRKIWRLKLDWDTKFDQTHKEEWDAIRYELNRVSEINFRRPYSFDGLEKAKAIEMHVFCDASAEAYGVAIYLCVHEEERSWTGLIAAKTRLAPNTKLSIPRLELLAAVTAAKYAKYVDNSLEIQEITKYLWGDSKCVISWTTSKKILPVIIQKAVKQIQEKEMQKFLYVPTAQNPADVISRGASAQTLHQEHWWRGPSWLADKNAWPNQNDTCEEDEQQLLEQTTANLEVEEAQILLTRDMIKLTHKFDPKVIENTPLELNPLKYRSFGQLARVHCLVERAAARFLRGRGSGNLQTSGPFDYVAAKRKWILWDQQRAYEPATEGVTNATYLRNLKVSTDEHGIIRVETRLSESSWTKSRIQPILLVRKSPLTQLIILSAHQNNCHAGTSHTLAAIRRQFWLPHGRREIYITIKNHCHTCRRDAAAPFEKPPTPQLPPFRVNRVETPFTSTGVDMFGPFKVYPGMDRSQPKKKVWVLIFTCLVTRAVHLEMLTDMTSEEYLFAFRRFIGRRGTPKLIVSDNAPEFEVVDGVFQQKWRRFAEADKNERYYAQHDIQWRFIPPTAPWMGGGFMSAS